MNPPTKSDIAWMAAKNAYGTPAFASTDVSLVKRDGLEEILRGEDLSILPAWSLGPRGGLARLSRFQLIAAMMEARR